jgi:hypothetical protein
MEYTLTLTLPKNTGEDSDFYFAYEFLATCSLGTYFTEQQDINVFVDELVNTLTGQVFNTLNYNLISNGNNWTIILTGVAIENCQPLGLNINIKDEFNIGAPFTSQSATPCNECQSVNLADCTDPDLSLPISDGTYTVSIQDHTTGNIYTQSIEVSDGGVDWNGTNTAGVFTPYSVFTVTLQDDNGDPVTWTSGSNDYNCVRLTFAPTTDTTPDA